MGTRLSHHTAALIFHSKARKMLQLQPLALVWKLRCSFTNERAMWNDSPRKQYVFGDLISPIQLLKMFFFLLFVFKSRQIFHDQNSKLFCCNLCSIVSTFFSKGLFGLLNSKRFVNLKKETQETLQLFLSYTLVICLQ